MRSILAFERSEDKLFPRCHPERSSPRDSTLLRSVLLRSSTPRPPCDVAPLRMTRGERSRNPSKARIEWSIATFGISVEKAPHVVRLLECPFAKGIQKFFRLQIALYNTSSEESDVGIFTLTPIVDSS